MQELCSFCILEKFLVLNPVLVACLLINLQLVRTDCSLLYFRISWNSHLFETAIQAYQIHLQKVLELLKLIILLIVLLLKFFAFIIPTNTLYHIVQISAILKQIKALYKRILLPAWTRRWVGT